MHLCTSRSHYGVVWDSRAGLLPTKTHIGSIVWEVSFLNMICSQVFTLTVDKPFFSSGRVVQVVVVLSLVVLVLVRGTRDIWFQFWWLKSLLWNTLI